MKRKSKILIAGISGFLCLSSCGKETEVDVTPTEVGAVSPLPTSAIFPGVDHVLPSGADDQTPTPLPKNEDGFSPILTLPPPPVEKNEYGFSPIITSQSSGNENPVPKPSPTPRPNVPEFGEGVSYRKISVADDVDVYVSEDREHPQIAVRRGSQFHYFDWDYNLDYGDPVVVRKNVPHEFAGKQLVEVLSITVPTRELKERFSPIGAREICGQEYLLDYAALERNYRSEWLVVLKKDPEKQAKVEFEYRDMDDKNEVFTVTVHDRYDDRWGGGFTFVFPGVTLNKQNGFQAIYSDLAHMTENGIRYRKFGVSDGETVVWLGKFCNSYFVPEIEGYYRERGSYGALWGFQIPGGQTGSCRPCPVLPESMLDLDGDGTLEKIVYRIEACEEKNYCRLVLTVNGTETVLKESLWGSFFRNYLFTASLDGRTSQLILVNLDDPSYYLDVYASGENGIYEAGVLTDANYGVREEDGRFFLSCLEACYPFQNDTVLVEYELVEGRLQRAAHDYYEFQEKRGSESNPPDRNLLTTLEDIELYTGKNSKETYLLPKGSHVVTLGGDLAGWILVEDRDTGRQGWLNVEWEIGVYGGYGASSCILPDGNVVPCEYLFEGLLEYG